MALTGDPLEFIHAPLHADIPDPVRAQARRCLLDLVGIAMGARSTELRRIISAHAVATRPGDLPIPLDGRGVNISGFALALGMTIDALDGHDGFNPAKGHIGCPTVPVALGLAAQRDLGGRDFLDAIVMAYEFGARVSVAQHACVSDYHTSGSWGAVAAAAVGARVLGLSSEQTRHALGIAEYHGPRSQMMRCIDHPTMVKDGAGWGSMCGAEAALLAQAGFTGAPALTVEQAPEFWTDLGARWAILEQYFKPYPVCRWAQAPVAAVIDLRAEHELDSADIERIEIDTFHESTRLANRSPRTTEEAQYSTSFPCALAAVFGDVQPDKLTGAALTDPEVLRLSTGIVMRETQTANAPFPHKRIARVTLVLRDGRELRTPYRDPEWEAHAPPSDAELRDKYHALADPVLGRQRSAHVASIIDDIETVGPRALLEALRAPPGA